MELTQEQRSWLQVEGVPQAEELAQRLGVPTNLALFRDQLSAGPGATCDMASTGCFMGYAYARVTAQREVLFCCNTAISVGSLDETGLDQLWHGRRWHWKAWAARGS